MQISGNFFGESHTGPFAKIALTFQPCDTYVLFYISLHRRVTSKLETGQPMPDKYLLLSKLIKSVILFTLRKHNFS